MFILNTSNSFGGAERLHAVLRDDGRGRWLHFHQPVAVINVYDIENVLPQLHRLEHLVNDRQLHAAGFISYECAPAFDAALAVRSAPSNLPLMCFGLYQQPQTLGHLPRTEHDACTLATWRPTVALPAYRQNIATIKDHIARGDTYQVNYTLRLHSALNGDPWALFTALERAQHAPFAAYIDTGEHVICSASPELFFTLDGEVIRSRPMKGTAPRGCNLAEDEKQIRWLRASEKDRAENVMIVDMIRNDIGRVAETGSVHAPELFEIERYPTVLQMTSTVQARTSASVAEILRALFPCASITGAPKVRTMQIIADLETTPRGVYTGAIGFIAPQRRAQFSVAIRTVVVDKASGRAEYGVGSGIVWDSDAGREYEECRVKARILTQPPPEFDLFESILWEPEFGFFLLDRHMQRLADAAIYFCYPLDSAQVRTELAVLAKSLPQQPHKVRVFVTDSGDIRSDSSPLAPDASPQPLRVALAADPVDSANPFLFYKTTHRAMYEQALDSRPDCDDVLLWNERGEITESSRANVVVRLDGRLLTPLVDGGLLGGVFRAELLAQGEIEERVILRDDLARAEAVYLINSVRRWMRAEL